MFATRSLGMMPVIKTDKFVSFYLVAAYTLYTIIHQSLFFGHHIIISTDILTISMFHSLLGYGCRRGWQGLRHQRTRNVGFHNFGRRVEWGLQKLWWQTQQQRGGWNGRRAFCLNKCGLVWLIWVEILQLEKRLETARCRMRTRIYYIPSSGIRAPVLRLMWSTCARKTRGRLFFSGSQSIKDTVICFRQVR